MAVEMKRKLRSGKTVVSSVSVSQEFARILDAYQLSPTEVFRKGVAVSLYELGIPKYVNPLNSHRNEFVKEFLKKIEEEEELSKTVNNIIQVGELLKQLKETNKGK